MLFKVTKEKSGDELIVHLEGILDGAIDFHEMLGTPAGRMTVDCRKVVHVNSSLVQPWLVYFHGLKAQGTKVRFVGCTDPLIQYFLLVKNFTCGGTVDSVVAPFFCFRCKVDAQVLIDTTNRAGIEQALASQICKSCRQPISFDEDPASYFRFVP
jgi:anti-anti-sigma regulatory factor